MSSLITTRLKDSDNQRVLRLTDEITELRQTLRQRDKDVSDLQASLQALLQKNDAELLSQNEAFEASSRSLKETIMEQQNLIDTLSTNMDELEQQNYKLRVLQLTGSREGEPSQSFSEGIIDSSLVVKPIDLAEILLDQDTDVDRVFIVSIRTILEASKEVQSRCLPEIERYQQELEKLRAEGERLMEDLPREAEKQQCLSSSLSSSLLSLVSQQPFPQAEDTTLPPMPAFPEFISGLTSVLEMQHQSAKTVLDVRRINRHLRSAHRRARRHSHVLKRIERNIDRSESVSTLSSILWLELLAMDKAYSDVSMRVKYMRSNLSHLEVITERTMESLLPQELDSVQTSACPASSATVSVPECGGGSVADPSRELHLSVSESSFCVPPPLPPQRTASNLSSVETDVLMICSPDQSLPLQRTSSRVSDQSLPLQRTASNLSSVETDVLILRASDQSLMSARILESLQYHSADGGSTPLASVEFDTEGDSIFTRREHPTTDSEEECHDTPQLHSFTPSLNSSLSNENEEAILGFPGGVSPHCLVRYSSLQEISESHIFESIRGASSPPRTYHSGADSPVRASSCAGDDSYEPGSCEFDSSLLTGESRENAMSQLPLDRPVTFFFDRHVLNLPGVPSEVTSALSSPVETSRFPIDADPLPNGSSSSPLLLAPDAAAQSGDRSQESSPPTFGALIDSVRPVPLQLFRELDVSTSHFPPVASRAVSPSAVDSTGVSSGRVASVASSSASSLVDRTELQDISPVVLPSCSSLSFSSDVILVACTVEHQPVITLPPCLTPEVLDLLRTFKSESGRLDSLREIESEIHRGHSTPSPQSDGSVVGSSTESDQSMECDSVNLPKLLKKSEIEMRLSQVMEQVCSLTSEVLEYGNRLDLQSEFDTELDRALAQLTESLANEEAKVRQLTGQRDEFSSQVASLEAVVPGKRQLVDNASTDLDDLRRTRDSVVQDMVLMLSSLRSHSLEEESIFQSFSASVPSSSDSSHPMIQLIDMSQLSSGIVSEFSSCSEVDADSEDMEVTLTNTERTVRAGPFVPHLPPVFEIHREDAGSSTDSDAVRNDGSSIDMSEASLILVSRREDSKLSLLTSAFTFAGNPSPPIRSRPSPTDLDQLAESLHADLREREQHLHELNQLIEDRRTSLSSDGSETDASLSDGTAQKVLECDDLKRRIHDLDEEYERDLQALVETENFSPFVDETFSDNLTNYLGDLRELYSAYQRVRLSIDSIFSQLSRRPAQRNRVLSQSELSFPEALSDGHPGRFQHPVASSASEESEPSFRSDLSEEANPAANSEDSADANPGVSPEAAVEIPRDKWFHLSEVCLECHIAHSAASPARSSFDVDSLERSVVPLPTVDAAELESPWRQESIFAAARPQLTAYESSCLNLLAAGCYSSLTPFESSWNFLTPSLGPRNGLTECEMSPLTTRFHPEGDQRDYPSPVEVRSPAVASDEDAVVMFSRSPVTEVARANSPVSPLSEDAVASFVAEVSLIQVVLSPVNLRFSPDQELVSVLKVATANFNTRLPKTAESLSSRASYRSDSASGEWGSFDADEHTKPHREMQKSLGSVHLPPGFSAGLLTERSLQQYIQDPLSLEGPEAGGLPAASLDRLYELNMLLLLSFAPSSESAVSLSHSTVVRGSPDDEFDWVDGVPEFESPKHLAQTPSTSLVCFPDRDLVPCPKRSYVCAFDEACVSLGAEFVPESPLDLMEVNPSSPSAEGVPQPESESETESGSPVSPPSPSIPALAPDARPRRLNEVSVDPFAASPEHARRSGVHCKAHVSQASAFFLGARSRGTQTSGAMPVDMGTRSLMDDSVLSSDAESVDGSPGHPAHHRNAFDVRLMKAEDELNRLKLANRQLQAERLRPRPYSDDSELMDADMLIRHLEERKKQLVQSFQESVEQIDDQVMQSQRLSEDQRRHDRSIQSIQREMEEIENILSQLEVIRRQIEEENKSTRGRLHQLRVDLEREESEFGATLSCLNQSEVDLEREKSALLSDQSELESVVLELTRVKQENDSERIRLESEVASLTVARDDLRRFLNTGLQESRQLEADLDDLYRSVRDLRDKARELESILPPLEEDQRLSQLTIRDQRRLLEDLQSGQASSIALYNSVREKCEGVHELDEPSARELSQEIGREYSDLLQELEDLQTKIITSDLFLLLQSRRQKQKELVTFLQDASVLVGGPKEERSLELTVKRSNTKLIELEGKVLSQLFEKRELELGVVLLENLYLRRKEESPFTQDQFEELQSKVPELEHRLSSLLESCSPELRSLVEDKRRLENQLLGMRRDLRDVECDFETLSGIQEQLKSEISFFSEYESMYQRYRILEKSVESISTLASEDSLRSSIEELQADVTRYPQRTEQLSRDRRDLLRDVSILMNDFSQKKLILRYPSINLSESHRRHRNPGESLDSSSGLDELLSSADTSGRSGSSHLSVEMEDLCRENEELRQEQTRQREYKKSSLRELDSFISADSSSNLSGPPSFFFSGDGQSNSLVRGFIPKLYSILDQANGLKHDLERWKVQDADSFSSYRDSILPQLNRFISQLPTDLPPTAPGDSAIQSERQEFLQQRIQSLQEKKVSLEREISDLEQRRGDLDDAAVGGDEQRRLQEKELEDGRRQLSRFQDEFSELSREKEIKQRELDVIEKKRSLSTRELDRLVELVGNETRTLKQLESEERELVLSIEEKQRALKEQKQAETEYQEHRESLPRLTSEVALLESDQRRLQEDVTTRQKELEQIRQEYTVFLPRIHELASLFDQKHTELDSLQREEGHLRSSMNVVRDDQQSVQQQKDRIESEVLGLKAERQSLQLENSRLQSESRRLSDEKSELEVQNQKLSKLQPKREKLRSENESLKTENRSLSLRDAELRDDIFRQEAKRDGLRQSNEGLESHEKSLQSLIQTLKDEVLPKLRQEESRLSGTASDLQRQVSREEDRLEELKKDRVGLQSDLGKLRMELLEASATQHDLSEEQSRRESSLKNLESEVQKLKEYKGELLSVIESLESNLRNYHESLVGLQADLDGLAIEKQRCLLEMERIHSELSESRPLSFESERIRVENAKLSEEHEILASEVSEMSQQREALQDVVSHLRSAKLELEPAVLDLEKKKLESDALQKSLAQLVGQKEDLQHRRQELEGSVSAEEKRLGSLRAEALSLESSLSSGNQSLEDLRRSLESLERSLSESKSALESTRSSVQQSQSEVAVLENRRSSLSAEADSLSQKIVRLADLHDEAERQSHDGAKELASLELSLDSLRSESRALSAEVESLSRDRARLNDELSAVRTETESLRGKKLKANERVSKAKSALESLEKEAASLSKRKSSQEQELQRLSDEIARSAAERESLLRPILGEKQSLERAVEDLKERESALQFSIEKHARELMSLKDGCRDPSMHASGGELQPRTRSYVATPPLDGELERAIADLRRLRDENDHLQQQNRRLQVQLDEERRSYESHRRRHQDRERKLASEKHEMSKQKENLSRSARLSTPVPSAAVRAPLVPQQPVHPLSVAAAPQTTPRIHELMTGIYCETERLKHNVGKLPLMDPALGTSSVDDRIVQDKRCIMELTQKLKLM